MNKNRWKWSQVPNKREVLSKINTPDGSEIHKYVVADLSIRNAHPVFILYSTDRIIRCSCVIYNSMCVCQYFTYMKETLAWTHSFTMMHGGLGPSK